MAACMRTRSSLFIKSFMRRRVHPSTNARPLLTDEFKSQDAWNSRLRSPVLQNITIGDFVTRLSDKYDRERRLSAIDMDIVASKLEHVESSQFEFVLNLFYRFRHSKDAVSSRESMSHAVIRSLLQLGDTERLMTLLRDKINYGIFLDHFTANLLLDYFIKSKQFQEAAEVATDLMLQEDLGHPLCRALSLYACHLRLAHLVESPAAYVALDASAADDEEVLYKRVPFIENPWYDDHFDIPTERQRVGKTLTELTRSSSNSDALQRGYQLIGWALYEKLDNVVNLLKLWLDDPNVSVAINSIELETVKTILERIKTKEPVEPKEPGLTTLEDLYPYITEKQKAHILERFTELSGSLKAAGKIATTESETAGRELAKRAADAFASVAMSDAAALRDTYSRWTDEQQRELDSQLKRHLAERKKRELAERLVSLRAREEKLRFFEQQTKIELTIADTPKELPIKVASIEEQFVAPPGERRPSGADLMKKGR